MSARATPSRVDDDVIDGGNMVLGRIKRTLNDQASFDPTASGDLLPHAGEAVSERAA